MKHNLLILTIFIFTNVVVSQINATTEDGKKVILKNDKTWHFADEEKQNNNLSSNNEEPIQNNFRGMAWGDSVSKLKSKYPSVKWEIETDGELKIYISEDYVGEKKVDIVFYFNNNKLIAGIYQFQEVHSSNNLYYKDFTDISNFLNKKYDMEKSEEWNDTTWRGNDDYIGYAIKMGYVIISETYEGQSTIVSHQISNDEFRNIVHLLIYKSIEIVKSQRDLLNDF